jgi:hypothetical protein
MDAEDNYETEQLNDAGDNMNVHRDQELDFSDKGTRFSVILVEKKKKSNPRQKEHDKKMFEDDDFYVKTTGKYHSI